MSKRTCGPPALFCSSCEAIIITAPWFLDFRRYGPVKGHEQDTKPLCHECGERLLESLVRGREKADELAATC